MRINTEDNNGKSIFKIFFIALFLLFMSLPLLVTLLKGGDASSLENRAADAMPQLIKEDNKTKTRSFNVQILSDMGEYFERNFATKTNLINADALFRKTFFSEPASEKVILGKNNWLYLSETLSDYRQIPSMSASENYVIAHNLKLMQRFVETRGGKFFYLTAPNKNSIYPEHMPERLSLQSGSTKNAKALNQSLAEIGAQFIDMEAILLEAKASGRYENALYFARDSHWNDWGAFWAYYKTMEEAGLQPSDFLDLSTEIVFDHSGDLDKMAFPLSPQPDPRLDFTPPLEFEYLSDYKTVDDLWIETQANKAGNGRLYMFRDSFGNQIYPYFAASFKHAIFDRNAPYDFSALDMDLSDTTVILERVERNLKSLSGLTPLMLSPQADAALSLSEARLEDKNRISKLLAYPRGEYITLQGSIANAEQFLAEKGEVYLNLAQAVENEDHQGQMLQAFLYLSEGEQLSFRCYIPKSAIPGNAADLKIYLKDASGALTVEEHSVALP